MKAHNIKADVTLGFRGWIDPNEIPILELAGNDDELNLSTVFNGKIELTATKIYEILRESKTNGRRPLLVMEILDDEPVRIPGMKDEDKDPDQGKLDLDKSNSEDIPDNDQKRDEAEMRQKKLLTKPRNVC